MQSESNTPQYRIVGAEEIDGNPLIAHLPLSPETDEDAWLALAIRLEFSEQERELPNSLRRIRLKRLRRFYAPVMKVQRDALTSICTTLADGYIPRNPMTEQGRRLIQGYPAPSSHSPVMTMIAGHSGMGKTTLVDRSCDYFGGQVWQHTSFRGMPFPETQLVYIRKNIPEHCTVGNLCATFGDAADMALGLKLYSGIFARIKNVGRVTFMSEIRKIITTHHVGALILDELQNLSLMGLGAKKIIALLYTLKEELSLPIIFIGTYKALNLLRSELSAARRLVEGGYFDIARPLDAAGAEWQSLCRSAWEYQWVREPIAYKEGIGAALYGASQGITAIMLTVFETAQTMAISERLERVDEKLIWRAYEERMKPLHPAVEVLRTGNPRLIEKFDDLYANYMPTTQQGLEGSADQALAEVAAPTKGLESAAPIGHQRPATAQRGGRKAKNAEPASRAETLAPVLSEAQIATMVREGSTTDLLSMLEGR